MKYPVFATNLRILRAKHDLSRRELADRAGISYDTYRQLEDGDTMPRDKTIKFLTDFFSVDKDQLFKPIL